MVFVITKDIISRDVYNIFVGVTPTISGAMRMSHRMISDMLKGDQSETEVMVETNHTNERGYVRIVEKQTGKEVVAYLITKYDIGK